MNNQLQNQNADAKPPTETLPAATIQIAVTFQETLTFYLRMISVREEKSLRQKLFGQTDDEQAAQPFTNNVELLKSLAVKPAEGIENFDAYFATVNPINERIAEYAVRGYFLRLQPDISFF